MKFGYIFGYILLALGILGSAWAASVFIALILSPPVGGVILAGLGAGFAWLFLSWLFYIIYNPGCNSS